MSTKAKEILFEEDARNKICEGIDTLADVVAITLGPRGQNVGLQTAWGSPIITSDGNSIAKDVELKDPFANMGVAMAQEVAAKIKERSGDGTTTGIVLLRAMVKAGLKNVASGANPTQLKRGMEKALTALIAEIDKMAIAIQSPQETKNIATVSASGNQEIGELIASCFEKVGKEGIVAIEEGKGTQTSVEMVEGMQFDRGYISSYFCTNADRLVVEMSNPAILITDKKISSVQDLLPLLQATASIGQELLIIADDLEGDALSTLVINKLRGTLKVCAVKAPGFGEQRKALLEDLAILTGAQFVTEDRGLDLKQAGTEVLGLASQILIQKEKTTIVGGKGDPDALATRIQQIESQKEMALNQYDREKFEQRKAKLAGGVALIQVGAPTESEMKKKKQMFEDSLHTTRAALEEGVVIGGGIALLRSSKFCTCVGLSPEEKIGAQILLHACEAPFKQIVANTGQDSSILLDAVLRAPSSFGFNALTEKLEDLLEAGIIDSVKVVKNSLTHAVSMAGVVLLSEALIAPSSEEE